MRCLTRYVILEFLKVFIVSLLGMTILMVLGVVGQETVRRGLGPGNVVRLLPYALPIALLYAIPATTLFSVCSVYGRLSASNEVLAIKAVGLTPMVVVWPIFIVAFLLSLLVVAMNDVAVTWGRTGLQRVVMESIEQIAYGMLRTHRSYRSERFSVNVQDVVDRKLIRPTFTLHRGEADPIEFTAEQAELSFDVEAAVLCVSLTNWEADGADGMMVLWPGTEELRIPLSDSDTEKLLRPSSIALGNIANEVTRQEEAMDSIQQSMAVRAACDLLTGEFARLHSPEWELNKISLQAAERRLYRLHTEPWRRWANGFSCLAFVMVGVPLSIRLKNSDMWTSFAICFLPILIAYYPLLALGVDQAKSGDLPPYSVWLGNIALFLVGVRLTRKMLRY